MGVKATGAARNHGSRTAGRGAGKARGAPTRAGRSDTRADTPNKATDAADPFARAAASGADWRAAVRATVEGLRYELVELERSPRGLLRVTIDRRAGEVYVPPGEAVTVDDCEAVTRQLQYALEVDGVDYARLEVSSPGLDRPLRTEADFERFSGLAVSLALKMPFQGRKHYQGVLSRAGAGWQITFADGKAEQVLSFTLDEVREARLVPVLDFKGSKQRAAPQANPDAAADPATMTRRENKEIEEGGIR
jgi:ribosome maturation factor RimP